MNRIRRPAIDRRLKHLVRKFSTTMLEVDARKAAVTSNRIAIPITENLVFAFDGVKTRWKTAPVRIHRTSRSSARVHVELGSASRLIGWPSYRRAFVSVSHPFGVGRSCDDF